MEGAGKNQEKTNLSLQMNEHSRDLLFHGVSNQTHLQNGSNVHNNGGGEAEGDELQLSLGLSMNGTFGVDPACKKVKRSSSILNLVFSGADEVARDRHAPLVRACSLPVENEEELERRKANQSARRLEARKKRMEKRNGRVVVKDCKEDSSEDNASNENGLVRSVGVQKTDQIGVVNGVGNGKVLGPSQGSIGSQKSGSSGFSDQQIEGATQNGEVKSPSSVRSVQVQVEQEAPIRANAPDRNGRRNNGLVNTTLLDMPYVCTRGVENRIDGFLYKYEKGDDVKIVCVCHGLFHSPAEFVRHGGGGDVENPLQHIVVNTAPLF